jgi:hypothetical protein
MGAKMIRNRKDMVCRDRFRGQRSKREYARSHMGL